VSSLAGTTFGFSVDLYYVKDQQGIEVDLLVVWDKKPWLFVECFLQAGHSLTALRYFRSRLGVSEDFLVTASDSHDHRDRSTGVHIHPATRFLSALV